MTIPTRFSNRSGTAGAFLLACALFVSACAQEDIHAGTVPGTEDARDATPAVVPSDTIDLRTLGYARGSASAPLTVVEFSDFGCPFCAMFSTGTYPDIHDEFVATGQVRWIFIPFVMGTFPNGELAARAGECAADQGKFEQMKARLYAGQNEWKSAARRRAPVVFSGFASDIELDDDMFAACFAENLVEDRIALNNRAASAAGIRATPSFLVDGRRVEGALPRDQFVMLLRRLTGGSE